MKKSVFKIWSLSFLLLVAIQPVYADDPDAGQDTHDSSEVAPVVEIIEDTQPQVDEPTVNPAPAEPAPAEKDDPATVDNAGSGSGLSSDEIAKMADELLNEEPGKKSPKRRKSKRNSPNSQKSADRIKAEKQAKGFPSILAAENYKNYHKQILELATELSSDKPWKKDRVRSCNSLANLVTLVRKIVQNREELKTLLTPTTEDNLSEETLKYIKELETARALAEEEAKKNATQPKNRKKLSAKITAPIPSKKTIIEIYKYQTYSRYSALVKYMNTNLSKADFICSQDEKKSKRTTQKEIVKSITQIKFASAEINSLMNMLVEQAIDGIVQTHFHTK